MAANQQKDIPVQKDPRTLNQMHSDNINTLQQLCQPPNRSSLRVYREDWPQEVDRWLQHSNQRFGEMQQHFQQMQQRMEQAMQMAGNTDVLDFWKDSYEIGKDGKVHFKAQFNVKGFPPENISVNVTNNRLQVTAKKPPGADGQSTEFNRIIDLPGLIDKSQMQCDVTQDGIMVLTAPIAAASPEALTFNHDQQLGIRPTAQNPPMQVTGKTGPVMLGNKAHLEMQVDKVYAEDEICVRMDSSKVYISGCHKARDGHGSATGPCLEQFNKAFDVPPNLDANSLRAQLINNTLIVEATCKA